MAPSPRGILSRVGQKLAGVAGGGALAMTLMACYGAPPPRGVIEPTPPDPSACNADNDQDQDGFCPPQDCDDTSGLVFPGGQDTSSDGLDQDCDGVDGPESGQ